MMSLIPTAMPRSGPALAARTVSLRQTKAPMVFSSAPITSSDWVMAASAERSPESIRRRSSASDSIGINPYEHRTAFTERVAIGQASLPSFRGDAKRRTRNLEIPRCAIAHLRSTRRRVSRNDELSALCRDRLLRLRLDLADRIDHGVEGQHGRRMPRLVVAHRLEQGDIGPLALRGLAVFLQHLADGLAQFAQFARGRADDMARHDRGRGLAERAGLHIMGKVGDHRSVHPKVDLDGRAA